MYTRLAGWTDILGDIFKAVPGVINAAKGGGYSPAVYNPATGISYPATTFPQQGTAPVYNRDSRIVGYDANGRPLYAAGEEPASMLPLLAGGAVVLFFMMRRRR